MPETSKKRPVELEDLFRIKAISEARFSPDGKQIVYGISHIDTEREKQLSALWLYPLETGEQRQLTSGISNDSSADWSPDGTQIAFRSARDEKPQIYVIPVDGGEARQLTSLNQPIGGGPFWSPDGSQIAFTAGPKFDEQPDQKSPYRVNRSVYRFDGTGYLDRVVQDIYVIPADGGEPKQLTSDRFNNDIQGWSPDGEHILYLAMADPSSTDPHCRSLRTVDLDGNVKEIHSSWGSYANAAWIPDGEAILFSGQETGHPIGTKTDLWVYDLQHDQLICRTSELKYGVGGGLRCDVPVTWKNSPRISPDGKTAFVNVQQGGTLQIYAVALEGKENYQPVIENDHLNALLDASAGSLLFVSSHFHNPCDLYTSNLDGSAEKRLTNINADLISELELARVEHMLFPSVDGEQVEGWALLPPNGDGPHPTVLYIHGGPHSAFGNVFNFDFLFLPAEGYTTLLVNHRASTGYGNEFATAIKGDWGNLDYQDLMHGVDHAIERRFSDPDRLGCTGISGGGNLSCWIVGHTDRFKAAMPENPVTNWNSFYGTSDIGVWFAMEELGGHPYEIPEVYSKCSPVTYAHNCTTPTLLVQGEHDYRCPAEQSEQFYTILKANGCVAEMLRFPNSSHGAAIRGALPMRRAHREALLDWMDRYVKNESGE